MAKTRPNQVNSNVELWATAHVPSVVTAATPTELQDTDASAIALGHKKDTSSFGKTTCLKHAGATVATRFLKSRALNSASENALGGCTSSSESMAQALIGATRGYPLASKPPFTT